jgi:hypothetical protein
MELFLNFAWLLLASAMIALWLCSTPGKGSRRYADRRLQFVSLLMLIVILLPAISMTDDLLAAQNPAEVDSCLRRDHDYANPHSILPAVAALLLLPSFRGLSFQPLSFFAIRSLAVPAYHSPALAAIQNRPPPAA